MSASSELSLQLPADVPLHARPAGLFVRLAMRFQSAIRITAGEREADAKSILAVLALGAVGGSTVRLRADGPDADSAIDALGECLRSMT
jgi:phosphotransferase system HPr (HPr) family protein